MTRYIHIFIFILTKTAIYHAIDQTLYVKNYKVVKPRLVHERWRRNADTSHTPEQERHADNVTYSISINGSERLLHLTKNTDFLSDNFVMISQDAQKVKVHREKPVLCHYHGYVEGYEDSLVALSTCEGLRGVILMGNESYGVEPVPQSKANEHLLFLLKDSLQEPFVCGLADETHQTEDISQQPSMSMFLREKRSLPQIKYVELVLVVDHLRFNYKNKNSSAVRDEMVQLANLLDSYYKPLNIRIALIGLEIFNKENPFTVEGNAGEVLTRFVKWRREELLPRLRHDVGQLIVGRSGSYPGGVLGMAFVGTVCSAHSSGAINVFSGNSLPYFSTVVAHELGHNLGMNHDVDYCTCNGGCVMGPSASGSSKFSNCSVKHFERLILNGGGVCLKNPPSSGHIITVPTCGNGILEDGEQCDCGSPEVCKNKCCDAATCTLTKNSACGTGVCCENCQIKVSGSPCRPSANPCDLPEFCNGTSEFCPGDFYFMDGLPCASKTAYCYEGRCQTLDYQCKQLFGSEATKADEKCFSYVNSVGDNFGNCGKPGDRPIACVGENTMCGKIQCLFDSNEPPAGAKVSVQYLDGGQIKCMNADFNMGTDVPDPAYVKTGSVCAPGKACVDFTCTNSSVLDQSQKCDAQKNCNSNGVCNDQFNCHCNDGWAPPNCDKRGRGGSINSGPAQIDYSLRDGLLIFFLLVVPILVVLIIVLLYVFKRDSLKRCVKGRPSKRNRSSNEANGPTNAQANAQSNGNATRTSTPQSMTQPNAPSRLVNTSVSQPRQGPGVPRPIPPRPVPPR
ncbi:disintegrin and metalloproteinase domain-containing protein 9 isoform X2 [Triplophysa rosa]|uniref:Disintegrin and metalloproteinase domain-containing protein 9 n=1 Tax=Triplophysa rosa TaxID=992332 RepID=A0A9W7WF85_TRIRA|nr:disintegrin and metalloproteinase domain-containing protein 9 isoform X2 [Triplophysa rosa]KAI7796954.1 disintegrin and metalloproteinase domain-containing protein 9 precursor [Triplophysa rosa]